MRWVWLLLAILVAVTGTAFTLQNNAFTAPLQLDLYFAAWKVAAPVGVASLMWAAFGVGLVLGVGGMGVRGLAQGRRIKQLEHEQVMGTAKAKDPWAG